MRDGWHVIKGWDCYVESNRIVRCKTEERTAWPYRIAKDGGLDNATGVNVNTFRHDNYTVR